MFKKVLPRCLAIALALACLTAPPVSAAANEDVYNEKTVFKIMDKTDVMKLKAKGAVLMDFTSGKLLMENNSHEKLQLASVTKVMSMLLIMEAIDSGKIALDTKVTISNHSYSMGGSQVWLEPGEIFTVDELLRAVAIHSANDATVALSEAVAGSEELFVSLMNDKAKELGMNDTVFLDCSGLTDDGHYSSAYDIALMSRELMLKHPKILEYTSTWHDTFRNNTPGKKPVSLDNTNKLIHYYQGMVGLKTGFTNKAGYCLSASAVRNNQQLIAVVLGEPDSNTRFAEVRKMMDYGFANFETTQVNNKGEEVQTVEVKKGLKSSVNAIYKEDVKLLLKKGEKGKIERQVNMQPNLEAPLKAGQKIGEVIYNLSGAEVGKADLVASNDIQRASFLRLFFKMVVEWFSMGRITA